MSRFFEALLFFGLLRLTLSKTRGHTNVTVEGLLLCDHWNATNVSVSVQSLEESDSEQKATDWYFCKETSCRYQSVGTLSFKGILDHVEFGLWIANDENSQLKVATKQRSLSDFEANYIHYVSLNSTRAIDYNCTNYLRIRVKWEEEGYNLGGHIFDSILGFHVNLAIAMFGVVLLACVGGILFFVCMHWYDICRSYCK